MPRLQGRTAQAHASTADGDPGAAAGIRREARPDRRDPARRVAARARCRPGRGRRRRRGGASDAMSVDQPNVLDTSSDRTLRVGSFEGPFDLLLHLCRTNEIDLAALPVRTITDQYLAHLEAMEFRDLEAAGMYLVMAATLIYLKSKLLVPPDETQDEQLDEDGLSLRLELEARLREYARVKALGEWLAAREAEQSLIWGRPGSTLPPPEEVPLEDLSVHLLDRTLS